MYYAAWSKPGGAVTAVVLLLARRCLEPTQRGRSGGQVDTLTPDGGLRYGETDALLHQRGLGGETQARDDGDSGPPSLPFPATDVQKVEDKAVPTDFPVGECRQNYAPYSTISTARQCGLEDDELLQQADDLDLKLEGG